MVRILRSFVSIGWIATLFFLPAGIQGQEVGPTPTQEVGGVPPQPPYLHYSSTGAPVPWIWVGSTDISGARVIPLNSGLSPYFAVEEGALIVEVAEGSLAFESGLRPGDVVIEVGGTPLSEPGEIGLAVFNYMVRRYVPGEVRREVEANPPPASTRMLVAPLPLRIIREGQEMEITLWRPDLVSPLVPVEAG